MSLMTTPRAPHPDHDPAPASRSPRRTVTLVVSVVFLLILVAGGTVAVLASRGDGGDTTTGAPGLPSPSPTVAAPQPDRAGWGTPYLDPLGRRVETPPDPNGVALVQDPSGRPPAGAGRCPAEPTDAVTTTFCTAAPQGVMWQQVDGVPMPFSTSDGPTAVDGELPTGFTQTAQGAALAAQQLAARTFASKAGALAITANRMAFDTEAERQAQLARVESMDEWRAIPLDRIQAYRIAYWAPDYAVIEFASQPPNGDTATWTTGQAELLWKDGDWQAKGSNQPGTPTGGTTTTLTGWTPWPGG